MISDSEPCDREWYFTQPGMFSIIVGSLFAVIAARAALQRWYGIIGQPSYPDDEAFWAVTLFFTLTAVMLSVWSISAIRRRLLQRAIPYGGFIRLEGNALHYHTLKNGSGSLRFADIK